MALAPGLLRRGRVSNAEGASASVLYKRDLAFHVLLKFTFATILPQFPANLQGIII